MALDLTTGSHPRFKRDATAGTTATQIQASPFTQVQIFASGAIYVFNDVVEGGAVPATDRLALDATKAASGYIVTVGGAVKGAAHGTVCVAAQASTVDLTVVSVSPLKVGP